jgi:hypothetical protein
MAMGWLDVVGAGGFSGSPSRRRRRSAEWRRERDLKILQLGQNIALMSLKPPLQGDHGPLGVSSEKALTPEEEDDAHLRTPFFKRVPFLPEDEYLRQTEQDVFGPPGGPRNPFLRDVTPEQERGLRRFQDPVNPGYDHLWRWLFSG